MENQNQNGDQSQDQVQNPYQQYSQNQNFTKKQSVVSIGNWIITFILMAIPLVNLIMLIIWAFGNGTSESKANWAKATLILYLIVTLLVICFWGSLAVSLLSSLGSW